MPSIKYHDMMYFIIRRAQSSQLLAAPHASDVRRVGIPGQPVSTHRRALDYAADGEAYSAASDAFAIAARDRG